MEQKTLSIVARAKDEASKELRKVQGELQKTGEQVKKAGEQTKGFSDKMIDSGARVKDLGSSLTNTVTPAALAVGGVMFKAGNDWKEGTNAIIVGTGASEDALKDMQGTMKSLAGQVPQNMGDIGLAIAEVNTRLGLTGKPLEDMSKKMLDFSRITGTDVTQNIANMTRVFGDWDVAAKDHSKTLDMIFGASQATGIGVDELSQKMVEFGAPLRSMGFSIEDTTALLANWEKEGVNTERILGSLSIAANNFAKEGVPMEEGLKRTIEQIKAAKDPSEALAIAQGVVGARAANDFQAAVREGRFELGDLEEEMKNTGGSIDDAAERTLTITDKLGMMKDEVMANLGPFGELGAVAAGGLASAGPALMGVGVAMQGIGKITKLVGKSFIATGAKAAASAAKTAASWAVTGVKMVAQATISAAAKIASAVAVAAAWIAANAAMLLGIGLIIAAVVGLVIIIVKNWDKIKAAAIAVWNAIVAAVKRVFKIIKTIVMTVINFFRRGFRNIWNTVKNIFNNIRNFISNTFKKVVNGIRNIFGNITRVITSPFKAAFNAVARLWNNSIGKLQFKAPDWVPGLGGKGFSLPKLPILAMGGIVTGPTMAVVGEGREPEAVLPLSKLDAMLENAGGNGDNGEKAPEVHIHLTLNGGVFTSDSSVRNLAVQLGQELQRQMKSQGTTNVNMLRVNT